MESPANRLNSALRGRIERMVWRVRQRLLDPADNVRYNRSLWDSYARRWADPAFRQMQTGKVKAQQTGNELQTLGDEWATPADVDRVVEEYIRPFVTTQSVVAELGSGGGRIASRVVGETGHFYCMDVSRNMLERARATLSAYPKAKFVHLEGAGLPAWTLERFDFIYSFDVFVHLDLHTMWRYMQDICAALKPGGRSFLHTMNLTTPAGWTEFAAQDTYSVEGHYFVSPEIIRVLVQRAGLELVKESTLDPTNFYLDRDYLFVVRRPSAGTA